MVQMHNILLESGTNELEVVEFYIDEELPESGQHYRGYYGVNVAKVLEIIRRPSVTELPQTGHPSVLGAFNLRSRIIPLIDLAIWLGKQAPVDDNCKVIVTEFNRVTNAFQVSGVTRIHRISWEQVEPPDDYVASFSNDSITGVVKIEERIIFILDLEKIVAELNPALALKTDVAPAINMDFRYKAMVVDDSGMIRSMLKGILEKSNFDVETANDGQVAWDRLNKYKDQVHSSNGALKDIVHVVISDIEMPAMDGHSLTKRIKEDPELSKLPVILFSSLISDKLRHKGDAVGADDQITKPEVGQLAMRSKELIEKYHGIEVQ